MKIGILTQPLQSNYGGLLQNYALQQVLIREGHEVETLDWGESRNIRSRLYRLKRQLLATLFPQKCSKASYKLTQRERTVICGNTNSFKEKYIYHSTVMHSFKDFKCYTEKSGFDVYIVGSDQCWRPSYNSFLTSMFLDFSEGQIVKRIAYAASFGTDMWEFSPKQTETCASLAKKFNFISVREDSGVKLCRDHLGVYAVHVLDPTMLLTKKDYLYLINAENEPQSEGTLFNYILDPTPDKSAFVNKVAREKGLKTFQVLPKFQAETRTKEDIKKHIEDCVFPRVTTWLRAFMDAEMTIVDSFHGMVFSIIFNKPFWVIGNKERGMSRFTSLLKMLGLESRIVNFDELDSIDINQPINWSNINRILEDKRSECANLLIDNLK